MKTYRSGMFAIAFATAAALVAPAPGVAQDADARWIPFLGCWEPIGEAAQPGVLCVQQVADGVELLTVVDGEQTTSDLMVADGNQRSRSMEGCEGWESSQFSELGRRVYTRSEFTCGESMARSSTGIMSLVSPTRWMDVRSVDVEGETIAWVQEYRLVGPEQARAAGMEDPAADRGMAIRTARMSAARSIDLADVEEAAQHVDAEAVEAWVVARGDAFDLDADALVRLDAAGMPTNVIDVLVAVSYPERFQVSAEMPSDIDQMDVEYGRRGDRYAYGGVCMRRSLFWDPFDMCYSPYGYRYGGFGYGGYGQPYYGGYGYGYGGYGTIIITQRDDSQPRGRVVNGQGYTRSGGSSGAGARSSGGGGSRAGAASSGGGSSTGRTAKPRGGGSSGGGTAGRTAKPRGGRGG